ncbi:hypothetical protein F4167_16930 [Candidatus Poribacteria bacterium]|nr:hypothetical protein [Candidatus Poribacteria bacterium]MYG08258.1 hypothetical protein [Candidatus Poribacteria bacterium]
MKLHTITKHIGAAVLLLLTLLVGGWIRLQGLPTLPTGQFASNDAYLYYSHAETLVTHGTLPETEMHRWVPLGRDLTEMLHGYAYGIAASYKVISVFFPDVTLYQIQRVAPTVCFLIGIAVLCCFLYLRFGLSTATVVGTLLAVMPGSIERSSAGFSDRDSWCWLLGILAVIPYFYKEGMELCKRTRYFCIALSGGFAFLGGLSWEGFGGFVLAIVAIELWRFLTTDTEEHLSEYVLWVLMFVPWLYLFCPAYHSGDGFSSHVTAFLLMPALVVLILRTLRYTLTRHPRFAVFLSEQVSARALSLLLCAVCLLIGLAYLALQRETFTQSIVPFSGASVMDTIGELHSPSDTYWYHRYGGVLFLASACLVVGAIRLWGKKAALLAGTLALFTAATFFRQYLYHVLSPGLCEYLFYGAVAFTPIAALGVAVRRAEPVKHEQIYIAMAVWMLLWLGLARDAQRYDFFIGVPLAFFSAVTIQFITTRIGQHIKTSREVEKGKESIEIPISRAAQKTGRMKKRKHKRKRKNVDETVSHIGPLRFIPQTWVKTGLTLACLTLLLFWEPPGSSARYGLTLRGYATRITPKVVLPGRETTIANTCQWLHTRHAKNAIVAADWTHGNYLNVLGGVKTIIDADHYIMYWIDLYEEHVPAAQSEREALEFLKTHDATHLLLSEEDMLYTVSKHTHTHKQPKHPLYMVPLVRRAPTGSPNPRMVPAHKNTAITSVEIDFHHIPITVKARLKNKKTVKLPYIKHFGESKETVHDTHTHTPEVSTETEETRETENRNGGILHHFDAKTQQEHIYYLSPDSWNSLAVKLFLRGEHSDAFVPVYPESGDAAAVKIWEIHYPPDITENPKYLETVPHKKGASE